jgi:DNA-binding NtrC family response regulator
MPEETQQVYLGVCAVIASPAMRQVMTLVQRVARTSAAVLITGETGAGKEIVARAIHHYSLRVSKPWVDVNCAALPEQLMESELFGHERGAFTGANSTKQGLFELAHTGSIFLDEVCELDRRMQVKLLRVLDGVPYYRLGGQRKITVDARIIAATNQDIEEAIRTGAFRSDLFHRLNQCSIRVPPLRERVEDIVPIAQRFLRQHNPAARLSPQAQADLKRRPWPGNVRELRNAITRAAIAADGAVIGVEHLPPATRDAPRRSPLSTGLRLEGLEREAIFEALRKTGGHHQKAANLLGVSRRTLTRKLKLYREGSKGKSAYVS